MKRRKFTRRATTKRSSAIKKIATAVVKKALNKNIETKITNLGSQQTALDCDFGTIQCRATIHGNQVNQYGGASVNGVGIRMRWSSRYDQASASGADDIMQTHIYVVMMHSDLFTPSQAWFKDNDGQDVLTFSTVLGTDKLNQRKNVSSKGKREVGSYTVLKHIKMDMSNASAQTKGLERYRTGVLWCPLKGEEFKCKTPTGTSSIVDMSPYIYICMFSVSKLQNRVAGTLAITNRIEADFYYKDA